MMKITMKQMGFFIGMLMVGIMTLIPQVNAYDAKYKSACDRESSIEAASRCLNRQYTKLDKELNRVYKVTMRSLPKEAAGGLRTQDKLRQSQRAWLKFIDTNCALMVQSNSARSGGMERVLCRMDYYQERIPFLRSINAQR